MDSSEALAIHARLRAQALAEIDAAQAPRGRWTAGEIGILNILLGNPRPPLQSLADLQRYIQALAVGMLPMPPAPDWWQDWVTSDIEGLNALLRFDPPLQSPADLEKLDPAQVLRRIVRAAGHVNLTGPGRPITGTIPPELRQPDPVNGAVSSRSALRRDLTARPLTGCQAQEDFLAVFLGALAACIPDSDFPRNFSLFHWGLLHCPWRLDGYRVVDDRGITVADLAHTAVNCATELAHASLIVALANLAFVVLAHNPGPGPGPPRPVEGPHGLGTAAAVPDHARAFVGRLAARAARGNRNPHHGPDPEHPAVIVQGVRAKGPDYPRTVHLTIPVDSQLLVLRGLADQDVDRAIAALEAAGFRVARDGAS